MTRASQDWLVNSEDLVEEEIFEVEVGCVRCHLVEYPARVPPPHSYKTLAPNELFDHLTQGEVDDASEVGVNHDVPIKPFDQHSVASSDASTRLPACVYLCEYP